MRVAYIWVGLSLLIACQSSDTPALWVISTPADTAYCRIDPVGTTILPNGRIIRPYGKTVPIAPHPYGLTLSPDGSIAVTANSGTNPFSISILSGLKDSLAVRQIPPGPNTDKGLLEAVFMGLAISPDNQKVYVSGGQANMVYVFDIATGIKIDSISGDQDLADPGSRRYAQGYLGDLCLSRDGKRLYVLDQIGFRVLIIDTEKSQVRQQVTVGRYPFGLTLSPDEQTLYVANVGMFEYSPIPGVDLLSNPKGTALNWPVYGYNSPEMREGVTREGRAIPGLGDPNAPESFSVWAIDLAGPQATVAHKIKTGVLVGEMVEGIPAVGGASPNSLVANDQFVFVSNGNNDAISVIDPLKDTVVATIFLSIDRRLDHVRGIIPFGLALSPDGNRLYVAESGINAVGVIDARSLSLLGHIPVGWFPSKLEVSPDGKQLIVANAKGYGSGPNGGAKWEMGPEGSYIGSLMKGSVTIMDLPKDRQLAELTQQVIQNNFRIRPLKEVMRTRSRIHPIPLVPEKSARDIRYIVFISKENRTYDEVFGQVAGGKGDPTLARYGLQASFRNQAGNDSVSKADVMPNHHALARRFAMSDNFYVDADHSADGHRWLAATYPNEWVETSVSAAYGGGRRMRESSEAPGNWALVGSSGAIYPEDYNEHGSLWDHLERNEIEFFNFGFGTELAGTYSDSTLKYAGVKYMVNFPLPGPLYDRSSRLFPNYNMAIPDQFRADMFIQEFEEKWIGEGKDMPHMVTLMLPNDHGAGERPQAGYPFRESYMADNDLALGRVVEFLSHTPYWKHMAIVVTEDDSQNGVDHIDAHRSILLVISPYAKRNYVGHEHYSFGSLFKTFWNILGIPSLNQYDTGASDLGDLFTEEADFSPYQAYPIDPQVFDPQRALDPFDEEFDWKALVESPVLDDPSLLQQEAQEADKAREQERNRQSNPLRPQDED